MKILHLYNTDKRQHYVYEKNQHFTLKPNLLYFGKLKKESGWHQSTHSHKFCEIMFVKSGKGSITVNGVKRSINSGDIVIYNPYVEHSETSDINNPFTIDFFAINKFEISGLKSNNLISDDYDIIYPTGDKYNLFCQYFEILSNEFENKNYFYNDIAQNLVRTIVLLIIRIINKEKPIDIEFYKSNKFISNAVNYIKENFNKSLTLEEIAEHCFVNKYYLEHAFTKANGKSIGKYIADYKIEQSKLLLETTDYKIREICEMCGYNDDGYFCRTFKTKVGISPLQYRKAKK